VVLCRPLPGVSGRVSAEKLKERPKEEI